MKKILFSSLVASAFTLSMTAQADTFTYLDYGFGSIDPDYTVSDDDYSSLSGAFETSSGPFIAFESTEYGSTDVMAIGAGAYTPVGSQASLFGVLQYVKVDLGRTDETGFRVSLGLRSTLSDRVELEGKVKYDDVFAETDTSFAAALRYYVSKNFSIAANYDTAELAGNDQNAMFASLRLSF
ncbi:hypothetical protein HGG82_09585 [Marinomonas sp. M1K-6]|uniref:Porin n=1 Tax=Marinomonas profundi TaxID=2726122 RepID=A0A847QWR2_9GAMM|nr:hypothetical protein [Marinomonas profundi]NLQ17878.1 hypothetical protein [Marinomonas profundi]UDV03465.1 hypothetical protein J8N69_01320 [Marinomonas profundi]